MVVGFSAAIVWTTPDGGRVVSPAWADTGSEGNWFIASGYLQNNVAPYKRIYSPDTLVEATRGEPHTGLHVQLYYVRDEEDAQAAAAEGLRAAGYAVRAITASDHARALGEAVEVRRAYESGIRSGAVNS